MASSKTRRVKAYVVHRRNWWYNDEFNEAFDAGSPVQTFLSRDKAEAYRREKECTARKRGELTNPFWFQGLDWDDWSSLSQAAFDRRVSELGVEPLGRRPPYDWWDKIEGDLTDEQRNVIWDLLDRVQLFEVVETTVELEE
jgi:hypothetical protein